MMRNKENTFKYDLAPTAFKSHQLVHKEERPFQCSQYDLKFKTTFFKYPTKKRQILLYPTLEYFDHPTRFKHAIKVPESYGTLFISHAN